MSPMAALKTRVAITPIAWLSRPSPAHTGWSAGSSEICVGAIVEDEDEDDVVDMEFETELEGSGPRVDVERSEVVVSVEMTDEPSSGIVDVVVAVVTIPVMVGLVLSNGFEYPLEVPMPTDAVEILLMDEIEASEAVEAVEALEMLD